MEAPLPPDAAPTSGSALPRVDFKSVACPSASACVIAGTYVDSSGFSRGLLEWGSGTSWQATESPLPDSAARSSSLESVACTSPSSCVAVGGRGYGGGISDGMIVTGSGTSWTVTKAPNLPNTPTQVTGLSSVSCPSPSACVAVGSDYDGSGNTGVIVTGSGSAWTAAKAPLPLDAASYPYATLDSVACASPSVCTATGEYSNTSGNQVMMMEAMSGSSWIPEQALPSNATSGYSGTNLVTCRAPSTCVLAGVYSVAPGSAITPGMLAAGSGTSWTATEAPLPATGSFDVFRAGACGSPTACVITGFFEGGAPVGEPPLLVTGGGTSWTATKAPLPADAVTSGQYNFGGLESVTCPSATACVAVGYYTTTSGIVRGLLLTGPA